MFDRAWSLSNLDGGRIECRNTRRTILIVLDLDEFDLHLDAFPGCPPSDLRDALEELERAGIVDIGEDECPPTDLPDGTVRIYLRPIETWEDIHISTELQEVS